MTPARNLLLDALRLLFAFAVVAIHLAPNTPAAEKLTQSCLIFAVPFFLMAAMYFLVGKVAGGEVVPSARDLKFERLWLPYLAWTLIYTGLHVGKDLALHRPLEFNLAATVFYGEAAVQMYFLPLLLLLECWAWSAALLWRAPGRRVWGGVIFILAGAFAAGGCAEHTLGFGPDVFLMGVLYPAGAFLLWRFRDSTAFRRGNGLAAAALVAGLLGLVTVGDPHHLLIYGRGPVAGYAAVSLALAWPVRLPVGPWAGFLLGCSYGIYLAHFLFVEAFEYVAARRGWPIKPYDVPEKLEVTLGVCLGSIGLIALARIYRPTRALLLGENT